MQHLFVLLHVAVALGGAFVVVEGHAGRNHVDHGQAVVRDGGLQNGLELLLVAAEGAGHEGGAPLQRQGAAIEGRQVVGDAGLERGAQIGGGRELALGEPVNAIVLDDVDHRQVAAHQVHELADADGCGVAVAGDAQTQQGAVGQHGAGGDGRHAAVHALNPCDSPRK